MCTKYVIVDLIITCRDIRLYKSYNMVLNSMLVQVPPRQEPVAGLQCTVGTEDRSHHMFRLRGCRSGVLQVCCTLIEMLTYIYSLKKSNCLLSFSNVVKSPFKLFKIPVLSNYQRPTLLLSFNHSFSICRAAQVGSSAVAIYRYIPVLCGDLMFEICFPTLLLNRYTIYRPEH